MRQEQKKPKDKIIIHSQRTKANGRLKFCCVEMQEQRKMPKDECKERKSNENEAKRETKEQSNKKELVEM